MAKDVLGQKNVGRTGWIFLGAWLLVAAAGVAESPKPEVSERETLQTIAETGRLWDEALAAREADLEKRFKDLSKRSRKAQKSTKKRRRAENGPTSADVMALFSMERSVLHDLRSSLKRERQLVRPMLKAESSSLKTLAVSSHSVSRIAAHRKRLATDLEKMEREALSRWEAFGEWSKSAPYREQRAFEQEAFSLARQAYQREWALLNHRLALTGSLSLEQGLARSARLAERERERYRRRARRLEESKKAWAGLLTAAGAAVILSNIQGSKDLSSTEKKKELQQLNEVLANNCWTRGGHFTPPIDDHGLGTCSL